MAGEIATAYVSLMPSFSGGSAAISRELDPSLAAAGKSGGTKLGGSMLASVKNFVGPMAAITAGAAVFGFLKGAQEDASDLNETVNKSKTIFGEQFAAIDKWSKDSATSMGLPRQAALDFVTGFGDMFSQIGFAGGEAASMAQAVVGLSADLGSFNNLPTEDVAQRISAAFRGEYDSLQALIPNINAARVEQEAMAATGKTNAKELTAQEKAAAVLAIVSKDGAAAMGDFAKTSDDNANKQKILSARFSDLKATIGQKLLPVMEFLLDTGMKVIDFFTGAGDGASIFGDVIGTVVGFVKTFITDNMGTFQAWWGLLQGIFGGLKTLVETVVGFITDFWKSHGEQIMNSVEVVWTAIKTVIESVLKIIKGIISTVIAIITGDWAGAWEAIKGVLAAAWEGIKAVVTIAIEIVKTVLTVAWAFIKSALDVAWDGIKTALSNAWEFIKGVFNDAVEWIKGVPQMIVDALTGLWDFVSTEAGEMKDAVLEWFGDLGDWIAGLPGWLAEKAGDVWGWIVSAAATAAAAAWQAIKDQFTPGNDAGSWIENLPQGERRGAGSQGVTQPRGMGAQSAPVDREAAGVQGVGGGGFGSDAVRGAGVVVQVTKHYAGRISAFVEAQEDARDIEWARALA